MTNVSGTWTGCCAVCGEPVAGYADPRSGATVPAPELGEEVRCLLCLLSLTGDGESNAKGGLNEYDHRR